MKTNVNEYSDVIVLLGKIEKDALESKFKLGLVSNRNVIPAALQMESHDPAKLNIRHLYYVSGSRMSPLF